MPISSDTADLEAYRLMRAGNFRAALPFAERAVSGKRKVASSTTRTGDRMPGRRQVSSGSSASTVPMPVRTASLVDRIR